MQPRVLSIIIYSCIIGMPLAYRQEFSDTLRTIRIEHRFRPSYSAITQGRITRPNISILLQCNLHHISSRTNIQISDAFMHYKQTHVQIEIIVHSWTSPCEPECFRIEESRKKGQDRQDRMFFITSISGNLMTKIIVICYEKESSS